MTTRQFARVIFVLNQIKKIPHEIGSLVNLETLYLSQNQIKEILQIS